MSIILSILALLIMIVLHEWGHFIAGRICKTPIHEFSVGMGPLIFQKKGKKETTFSLRAIPLGGYCAFDANDATGVVDSTLNKLPVYKRIFIFIAGPLMNILTAIVLYFSIAMFMGFPTVIPVVDTVVEDGACYGILQENDEILKINGKEINGDINIMSQYINESAGEEIDFTILRNNKELEVKISPVYDEANGKYLIGIIQKTVYERVSFIESVKYSFLATVEAAVSTFDGLIGLITGRHALSEMSGIVGIVGIVSSYATPSTFSIFLSLCGLISVNLGIMNLLPIPGLDGSKILFGIYELIFRKPIPEKIETTLTLIGFGLLMLLLVVVTFSDIIKLF